MPAGRLGRPLLCRRRRRRQHSGRTPESRHDAQRWTLRPQPRAVKQDRAVIDRSRNNPLVLSVLGTRASVKMVRRTVMMRFGNVRVGNAVAMYVQPRRLRKSRQEGKPQNYSER